MINGVGIHLSGLILDAPLFQIGFLSPDQVQSFLQHTHLKHSHPGLANGLYFKLRVVHAGSTHSFVLVKEHASKLGNCLVWALGAIRLCLVPNKTGASLSIGSDCRRVGPQ